MSSIEDVLHEPPAWQGRVVQERVDLEYALRRLNKFIRSEKFDTLLYVEQEKLRQQREIMERYYEILGNRICNFDL